MPLSDSPSDLAPSQRLAELATLLARGLLRSRDRPPAAAEAPPPEAPENISKSRAGGLEVSAEVRLTVHTGLREPHSETRREG
jgi:hypothetical protein